MAPTFTATWLVEHIAKSSAPLPTLMNAEGDTLQFAETRFKLRHAAAAEVVSRLGELKELLPTGDKPPSWSWLGKISASSSKRPSEGLVMQTHDSSGAQVLGSLKLENGILQLSTNSVARMERGSEMLRAALGELVGAGLSDITSVEDALKKHRAAPAQQAHPESAIPPEVAAEIGRQFHDRHYRAWIDMRLPALDGLSPRQAVRTKHGRDEVVALLKQVENMEARSSRKSGQPPYDFGWLWQELGLAGRRR